MITSNKAKTWNPQSWTNFHQAQKVDYPDRDLVNKTLATLHNLPPLVTAFEIENLKTLLAACSRGEAFLLQGGDCAESFSECRTDTLTNKLKILLQMSLVLLCGMKKPIIRVGRIAGQYAKPRSALMETFGNTTLPSYRGDIINGADFNKEARTPNPTRMLEAYHYSAITLNFLRALLDGGFASLEHPEYWNLDFIPEYSLAEPYQRIKNSLHENLSFLQTIGGLQLANLKQVELYSSHELLLLPYEQSLTHFDTNFERWFNLGTHFPWIGMRTLDLDSAHLEFARGLANPIALKIGGKLPLATLAKILEILDPDREPGKLTLIHRFGISEVEEKLPPLIEGVKDMGHPVVWSCDPMHGNTHITSQGHKTRRFDDILKELEISMHIHQSLGKALHGVHFELTGENVTECIGGTMGITEADLSEAYKSLIDPRLNYYQALEMALWLAQQKLA